MVTVLVAALGLVASACGAKGDRGDDVQAGTSVPAPRAPETAPAAAPGVPYAPTTTAPGVEVPKALRFTATGVGGMKIVGADYAGKDVALWFWAPW